MFWWHNCYRDNILVSASVLQYYCQRPSMIKLQETLKDENTFIMAEDAVLHSESRKRKDVHIFPLLRMMYHMIHHSHKKTPLRLMTTDGESRGFTWTHHILDQYLWIYCICSEIQWRWIFDCVVDWAQQFTCTKSPHIDIAENRVQHTIPIPNHFT